MGRKKKVVENTAVNPEVVEKEVIETEVKSEVKEEKITPPKSNMVKVRILSSVSVKKLADYEPGQIVTIPDYIYNQISQACVKL